MQLIAIGVNYRTCPVDIREKLNISSEVLANRLSTLSGSSGVLECVVVSTCNRTEVYAHVNNVAAAEQSIVRFLSMCSGLVSSVFMDHLVVYHGQRAVQHLFEVASGLDSMVIGETQILGQVRDAYRLALDAGTVGQLLDNVMRRAVTAAKRAHTETGLSQHAVSVSYAAVELAKRIFEQIEDKTVLIIGAGKMGELTAKHMRASGATRIFVANRTYERAVDLAERFNGKAVPIDVLQLALKEADIVISSTGAKEVILSRADIAEVMKHRRNRPLFLVDIAVPRDMDPAINKLANVYLYDIDDLQNVVSSNVTERVREAEKARAILHEEIVAFDQWYSEQQVVPVIAALREKGTAIQMTVMQSLSNKLPQLSEREQTIIQKHTMSIVNQLLRDPVLKLKELASEPQAQEQLAMAIRLFGLDAATAGYHETKSEEGSELSTVKGKSEPVIGHEVGHRRDSHRSDLRLGPTGAMTHGVPS